MHHAGAQPRQIGRPARGQLVRPHHSMDEDIVADPHDVAAPAILDLEVLVGNAAGERYRVHAPETRSERGDARQGTLAPRQDSRLVPPRADHLHPIRGIRRESAELGGCTGSLQLTVLLGQIPSSPGKYSEFRPVQADRA